MGGGNRHRAQTASTDGAADRLLRVRAQGCLLGQLAGDALGGLVEFQSAEQIRQAYPDGVRDMADGGTWETIAGQPTDDSEMALALARTLAARGSYDAEAVREAYLRWLRSKPFSLGRTVSAGLQGTPNSDSQSNGALMRISPLGIFCARLAPEQAADWARQDAALTHPAPVCLQANAIYVMAVAQAVRAGPKPAALYQELLDRTKDLQADPALLKAVQDAADTPAAESEKTHRRYYARRQGWVLTALQNALWQLLHAPNPEQAIVASIAWGGDTDTNAAICGALLGAVHGREAIPARWTRCLLQCRPRHGHPQIRHPRPQYYWPTDALELAEHLAQGPSPATPA